MSVDGVNEDVNYSHIDDRTYTIDQMRRLRYSPLVQDSPPLDIDPPIVAMLSFQIDPNAVGA